MKKIDEYLNSLYKNDKSKEVKELKEELRGHLETSAHEFIANGYSEEEAQIQAINQFDDGTDMLKDLHKALNESKKDNEKLNKRFINIFRNIFILSLILGLATMVYGDRLIDKIEYIPDRLGGEVYRIQREKNINNSETYKDQIEILLENKEFKYVRSFDIIPDSDKKPVYSYSDDSNQTHSLVTRGNNIGLLNKNGEWGRYEVRLDYSPVSRVSSVFNGISYVGIISLVVYIVLLVRFKIKFKKHLIYKQA
ncbi:permease prefix domain 1-containing protein [Romboutsia sedimentorum]|uniref:permease prefix domain 1-containing protein n=1 Tax=Romboutsia sedimentorum TaxID=1368474 RepID=UPI0024DEC94A|nr:permease prefix domain 1-containing protein [Romboutsia sedimentorum]MDK2584546.1 permease prefix domain 1-containing protein [Romboutsia sedimentorum]